METQFGFDTTICDALHYVPFRGAYEMYYSIYIHVIYILRKALQGFDDVFCTLCRILFLVNNGDFNLYASDKLTHAHVRAHHFKCMCTINRVHGIYDS